MIIVALALHEFTCKNPSIVFVKHIRGDLALETRDTETLQYNTRHRTESCATRLKVLKLETDI